MRWADASAGRTRSGLIKAIPDRVSAAVLQQPIGLSPKNRELFFQMFDGWADALRKKRPELDAAAFRPFRDRMYGETDFVFNVSRDFVRKVKTPLLVLRGNDDYHPSETSDEIAKHRAACGNHHEWKTPETVGKTVERVRAFLKAHTPK